MKNTKTTKTYAQLTASLKEVKNTQRQVAKLLKKTVSIAARLQRVSSAFLDIIEGLGKSTGKLTSAKTTKTAAKKVAKKATKPKRTYKKRAATLVTVTPQASAA